MQPAYEGLIAAGQADGGHTRDLGLVTSGQLNAKRVGSSVSGWPGLLKFTSITSCPSPGVPFSGENPKSPSRETSEAPLGSTLSPPRSAQWVLICLLTLLPECSSVRARKRNTLLQQQMVKPPQFCSHDPPLGSRATRRLAAPGRPPAEKMRFQPGEVR